MKFVKRTISVIVAIICGVTIAIFLLTNIIRFTDVSSAIAYILVAGIVGVLIWGFKPRISDKIDHNETKEKPREKEVKTKDEVEDRPKKIQRKTIKVRVEEYDELRLNLRKGDLITGKISSDGFFNVYFLTESSFKSFKNDYNFHDLGGSENVSHFEPEFEAPRKDTFYVVLQNADKKNIVVNVELFSS